MIDTARAFTVQRCDYDTARSLRSRLFGHVWITKRMEHWIVCEEGRPVGFASLLVNYPQRGTAFLAACAIAEEARGCGLQRRLIAVRELRARELGCRELVTYTRRANLPSANNLIACGFTLARPEMPYGSAGCLYFAKPLR